MGWRIIMLDAYKIAIIGRDEGTPEYTEALALLRQHTPNDVLAQGTVVR